LQTLVQVVCVPGKSLRDSIVNDRRIEDFRLAVREKLKPGRKHGWAKIHSIAPDRRGALNIEWYAEANILLCRIINRGAGRPDLILGDFIDYLFQRHRRRIKAVNIIPT